MRWPDEKIVAILALLLIALTVIFLTKDLGLDVIINIVCGISGLVTGSAMTHKSND